MKKTAGKTLLQDHCIYSRLSKLTGSTSMDSINSKQKMYLGLQCLHLYLMWTNIFSFVIIPWTMQYSDLHSTYIELEIYAG